MAPRLFILIFHGLGEPRGVPPEEVPFWVDVPSFEAILDMIRDRPDVQVTFDDSYRTDYEVAFPALRARGLTAKFFVLVSQLDQPGYMTAAEVQSLAAAGMTIGNHGLRHRPWTDLNGQELEEELVKAKSRLEHVLDRPITEAACPFGRYNRRVLRALRHSGYDRIYTSDDYPARADSWFQSRFTVFRTSSLFEIRRNISEMPRGPRNWWRALKLKLKQWS